MSNKLNEAVELRREQKAFTGPTAEKSFTEYLREGVGYVGKAKDAVGRATTAVVDTVVPATESERVEAAVVSKVNRDEALRKAEYIGEAVGSKVAQTGGFLLKLGYTAIKAATGMTSAKVKATLREIDELDNPSNPDTD
ncbi:MAG: hypothetical protein HN802_02685 [Candidatus Jacksonbacteria bacterium]|jgi:hypothetical protein|nr:hypothetical protein [Candidatus Jacksonbacteria bacterium]